MHTTSVWALWPEYALATVPVLYLAAALAILLIRATSACRRLAAATTGTALVLALIAGIGAPLVDTAAETGLPGLDHMPVTPVVLLLIALLAWVIQRFAAPYLAGDQRQRSFLAGLLFTLAAVAAVVVTDNMAVLALAWLATSIGLQRLLTLYEWRHMAVLAAQKKFIASRAADLCLFAALVLLIDGHGSLSIPVLSAQPLLPSDNMAALLIAITALIRCAQLPMHGWLIQVMEAPTPVSALLHAGVVNLGGLVLIKTAWLLDGSPAAQAVLVIVGGLTALLAALVMTTQTSIKSRLAWSTSAQMGFMLVECGLGAYPLALLHLLGHSLYKAHAFLSSGSRVDQARRASLFPAADEKPVVAGLLPAAVLAPAVPILYALGLATGPGLAMLFIGTIAVTPLLGGLRQPAAKGASLVLIPLALLVLAAGPAWHASMAAIVPARNTLQLWQVLWVTLLFIMLLAWQLAVLTRPGRALLQRWRPWFAAGFYLDDLFTRFALWIHPAPNAPGTTAPAAPWIEKEQGA